MAGKELQISDYVQLPPEVAAATFTEKLTFLATVLNRSLMMQVPELKSAVVIPAWNDGIKGVLSADAPFFLRLARTNEYTPTETYDLTQNCLRTVRELANVLGQHIEGANVQCGQLAAQLKELQEANEAEIQKAHTITQAGTETQPPTATGLATNPQD